MCSSKSSWQHMMLSSARSTQVFCIIKRACWGSILDLEYCYSKFAWHLPGAACADLFSHDLRDGQQRWSSSNCCDRCVTTGALLQTLGQPSTPTSRSEKRCSLSRRHRMAPCKHLRSGSTSPCRPSSHTLWPD